MRLIRGLTNLKHFSQQPEAPLANGCVATIGNFDGVHLGHQTIIDQVREKAIELGVPSVVMVFEPQPREFFQGDEAPPTADAVPPEIRSPAQFRHRYRAVPPLR